MKTFQDGDPLFGVMMNAIANLWPNGTAVLSGCTPTGSGAARQITVAAGTVVIGGTVRSVSQQTKTLDAATFDRYDLLSVNSSGTVVVTKGTEERRVPALPANSVPIAICLIEAGQTTLPADRIYDTRMDALRLSVLNIDADKDWGGKSITNLRISNADITNGRLTVTRKQSYAASDNVLYSFPTEVSARGTGPILAHQIRVPLGYLASKFRIKFDFKWAPATSSHPNTGGYATVEADGVSILSVSTGDVGADTWKTFSIDVENVSGRTLFQLYVAGHYYGISDVGIGYVRNFCICGTEETFTQIIGSDTSWG